MGCQKVSTLRERRQHWIRRIHWIIFTIAHDIKKTVCGSSPGGHEESSLPSQSLNLFTFPNFRATQSKLSQRLSERRSEFATGGGGGITEKPFPRPKSIIVVLATAKDKRDSVPLPLATAFRCHWRPGRTKEIRVRCQWFRKQNLNTNRLVFLGFLRKTSRLSVRASAINPKVWVLATLPIKKTVFFSISLSFLRNEYFEGRWPLKN